MCVRVKRKKKKRKKVQLKIARMVLHGVLNRVILFIGFSNFLPLSFSSNLITIIFKMSIKFIFSLVKPYLTFVFVFYSIKKLNPKLQGIF